MPSMKGLDTIPAPLRPMVLPLGAVLVLVILAIVQFSQARDIDVPPAPEELYVERVRLDEVRHTREQAKPIGPMSRVSVQVHLATSQDWPGLTFRFDGAAAGMSIVPPATFDLYLSRSLAEQAEIHRQWPNVHPTLVVHGVGQDGTLLLDPQTAHDAALTHQRQRSLFGWAALLLAILPGFLLVRQARTLWRDHIA